ncbi:Protein RGF1 INDUCIBLE TRANSCRIPTION FACTOR 1 [Cardamine amara subsp. amara]|uniref:Protein RGF1 INDUCIBLE TRANSCRIPTION FACTOR 1 n=1 Tax=Cardamine amara subsp. amara TaxID=228776 RepID=A0ABD0ZEF9_CARAN
MAIGDHENPNQEIKPRNRRIMEAGELEEEQNQWPSWLKPLLKEHFFGQCQFHHGHSSKSECNMYCLDCTNNSLCSFCLAHHNGHRTIQIRRSSYHDVIRVNEIQKYLDISSIQTFVINSAKVVFLNERPPPKPGKGVTNTCEVCYRSLQDDCFRFCSIGCKVVGTSKSFKKRVKHTQIETEDSSNSSGISGIENNSSNLQSSSPSPPQLPTSGLKRKRRKGIPHRAPFR